MATLLQAGRGGVVTTDPYTHLLETERHCLAAESAIDAVLQSASGPHTELTPCLVNPEADGYTVEINLRLCVAATVPAIVAELRRILAAIEGQ